MIRKRDGRSLSDKVLENDVPYWNSSVMRQYTNISCQCENECLAHWAFVFGLFLREGTSQDPLRWLLSLVSKILRAVWHKGGAVTTRPSVAMTLSNLPLHNILQGYARGGAAPPIPGRVRGFPNFGQTCFLNAVLQSLASLDNMLGYTRSITTRQQKVLSWNSPSNRFFHLKSSPTREIIESETSFSEILLAILEYLNGQSNSAERNNIGGKDLVIKFPRELLWRISLQNPQFKSRIPFFGALSNRIANSISSSHSSMEDQQDAQELFQALLEMMIADFRLEDSYTLETQTINGIDLEGANSNDILNHALRLEEKNEDNSNFLHELCNCKDKAFTQLSGRWTPRTLQLSSIKCNSSTLNSKQHHFDSGQARETNNSVCESSRIFEPPLIGTMGTCRNIGCTGRPSESVSGRQVFFASACLSTKPAAVIMPSARASQLRLRQYSKTISPSTGSSTASTPFSCWTGSFIQCRTCYHTKPIRNQEWRDIPVIPTAASNHIFKRSPRNRVAPPCTMEECLAAFTRVEQVHDVECGNCTLEKHLSNWKVEVELLRGAVESSERKIVKQSNHSEGIAIDGCRRIGDLRLELEAAELNLQYLNSKLHDPDDFDPRMVSCASFCSEDDPSEQSDLIKSIRVSALKCLALTRLPAILCLHVQRRCYDPLADQMFKTVQHVQFEEIIDLAPFCAFGRNSSVLDGFTKSPGKSSASFRNSVKRLHRPILYRLASVIEHKGNASGGHYVCYRQLPNASMIRSWYYCSDETVLEVPWSRVRQAQAYMLFYEAIQN